MDGVGDGVQEVAAVADSGRKLGGCEVALTSLGRDTLQKIICMMAFPLSNWVDD